MRGKHVFGTLFVFSFVITLLWWRPLSAEVCNRVVAIVNDEVITLHELNKKIKEMTGFAPADLETRNRDEYLAVRRGVLDLLINERITQEKIKELGIQVQEKEVEAAIEQIKRDNQLTHEDLLAGLEKQGMTYEKYKERMKGELERIKLIEFEVKSKIIIREEAITQYYETHKEQFSTNEKVRLANIFLMRKEPENKAEIDGLYQKAQDILARVKAGEDFAELARKFSQGPGADDGGDLGTFRIDQLEPNLRQMFEAMPVGTVSEPIVRPNGIQLIKIVEREKGKGKSLEEVRNAIYAILYRQEVNRRYTAWIEELRETCYTKIIF